MFDEDVVLDMYAPMGFKEVSRQHVVKLQVHIFSFVLFSSFGFL